MDILRIIPVGCLSDAIIICIIREVEYMTSSSARKSASTKSKKSSGGTKKWSAHVNETSDSLDLEEGIFKSDDPKRIAQSLKRSAEQSDRKKGTPLQSSMSMLNFYINRAGKNLPKKQKETLESAKDELRKLFNK